MIHAIFKQKGSRAVVSNFRDVQLATQLSKVSGKHIRPYLISHPQKHIRTTQWGSGLYGGDTNVSHLFVFIVLS